MNKTLSNLFIFAAGAIVGSVVTWKLVKTRYETRADQEIESMREYYHIQHRGKEAVDAVKGSQEGIKESSKKAVEAYKNYAGNYTSQQLVKPDSLLEEEEEEENMPEPYIITPEEFSDSDYSAETLTYYADGVIEDDFEEVWSEDEIRTILGKDFASHFGEYEKDSVYVRNDYKEIDYEILRDTHKYSEMH